MYRTLLGIAAAILGALLLVGLSFSSTAGQRADFRFLNGTEPQTLDPHLVTGQPGGRIIWAIFEGLTRNEAKSMQPVPGVAERWDLSPDQTRYTFHLRKNAKWSDGRPVTAQDFVYSWRRALNPKTGSLYAYMLHMVKLAEEYNTYAGHAQSIDEKIRPALAKLKQEQPGGIPGDAWQRFLSDNNVHDAAKAGIEPEAPLPEVTDLLARQAPVTAAEIGRFESGLRAIANNLRTRFSHAEAHLGKDEGFFAPSDHEFVVELKAPTAYFLEVTSFYTTLPVPRWAVEAPGRAHNWFLPGSIVNNGPFRIESWRVNDRIRLVRNEHYWDPERPKADSIEALAIENAATSLNLYLTGEVDWLPSNYPNDLVDEIKNRADFYKNPGWVTYYYRFNCSKPPFDDPRVRHAISLAVDRKLLVDEVLRLGQLPAHYFVPPGAPGYKRPESAIRLDVEQAKRLLADAGYPEGRGFPEMGILYNTNEGHKTIAEFVADQLRRHLGIQAKAYNQEWQSFLETVRNLDYDVARAGWIGDYLDPNTFLDMWVTNGGNNQTGFSSQSYDRLISAAGNIVQAVQNPEPLRSAVHDPSRLDEFLQQLGAAEAQQARGAVLAKLRLFLLSEAERILVNEAFPVMPIYFYVQSGLVRSEIGGFYTTLTLSDGSTTPNVTDRHPLDAIFVKPEAP